MAAICQKFYGDTAPPLGQIWLVARSFEVDFLVGGFGYFGGYFGCIIDSYLIANWNTSIFKNGKSSYVNHPCSSIFTGPGIAMLNIHRRLWEIDDQQDRHASLLKSAASEAIGICSRSSYAIQATWCGRFCGNPPAIFKYIQYP
jgi:hypothetical protein